MLNFFDYDNLVFELSLISTLIIGIILFKLIQMRKSQGGLNVLMVSNGFFIVAMVIVNLFFILSHIPNVSTNQPVLYAISYAFYFVFWITGINYFLKNIVRLPPSRAHRFNLTTKLLNLQLVATVALTIFTSGLVNSVKESAAYNDFVEASFAVISQVAIITFVYFYRKMGEEIEKNSSKLIKARLQLMRYAVATQIVMSIFIAIVASVLVIDILSDNFVELILFSIINVLTVVCSFILIWSIDIPNKIRIRFNLTPSRYQFIIKSRL